MDTLNPQHLKPKFINTPEDCVREALEGMCFLNPNIQLFQSSNILVQKEIKKDKVAVLCGGGSGHEPAHAGFVLKGMLTGAVCGGVFASPSHKDVLEALKYCSNEKGTILIIKNYTGDVLNFNLAAGMARAQGIKVETLLVEDDVALGRWNNSRGIAGVVIIYKILGAAAELGKSLNDVLALGQSINKSLCSLGVSSSACALPGSPEMFKLGDNEMELGTGIHGEKGKERTKLVSADELVKIIMDQLLEYMKTDSVILALNNLGNTTEIELMVLMRSAIRELKSRSVTVCRVMYGKFMTSLDMHGVSFSLLDIGSHETETQNLILNCLDSQVVGNLSFSIVKPNYENYILEIPAASKEEVETSKNEIKEHGPVAQRFKSILKYVLESLCKQETYLNSLDAAVGDGDIGFGVTRSGKALISKLDQLPLETSIAESLNIIADIIASSFGGSSGPLYGTLIMKGALVLSGKSLKETTQKDWAKCFSEGVEGLKEIGKVNVGDRTMIDALSPAARAAVESDQESLDKLLNKIVDTAKEGCEKAKSLKGRKGRSAYLGDRVVGLPDPGCELAYLWLSALKEALITFK